GNSRFDIPTYVAGPTTVYTLMNSIFGTAGSDIATVEFRGLNGSDARFDLVEGTNIRDHFNGSFNNTIAPGTPSAAFGSSDRLDGQTFVLPAAFATDTLTDIIVTGHGGNPQGEAFLAAVTVQTAGGASVPVTLGIASGPPNSATVTVPSSVAPYPD